MSHNSPTPDKPQPDIIDIHSLVAKARYLKSEDGENPEYDRALVEIITDLTPPMQGLDYDQKRAVIERLVLGEAREFEIRGRIVIEYAMGFSEAEARQWFPKAGWHLEPDTSVAGNIETDHLEAAPAEFWHFVNLKRDVVLDLEGSIDLEKDGWWKIRDEVTGVVEL